MGGLSPESDPAQVSHVFGFERHHGFAHDQGKKIYLAVDGAMAYATVWLNGQFVGGWPCGYASWQVDLTPYIKFGSCMSNGF